MSTNAGLSEPQRELILEAMEEFYCPIDGEDLGAFAAVFATDLSQLPSPSDVLAEEVLLWRDGGSGPPWLSAAFTGPNGTTDPAHLTRSDWSLDLRVLVTDRDQVRHMWLVKVFSELLLTADEQERSGRTALVERLRHHALAIESDLPLARQIGSIADDDIDTEVLNALREAAEDAYSLFADLWQSPARLIARELEGLDDYTRLFGHAAS